jgi:hypothetical protein
MIVGRNERVETLLHFFKIMDFDPLPDVEPRDRLDSHLKNDSDGAEPSDRRVEQIVPRLAQNNVAVAVEQLEAYDGVADESVCGSRSANVCRSSMHVCRKDARDTLCIVRWQRGESQAILGEKFDDIAKSGAAF